MTMKSHVLAGLQEMAERWQTLLEGLPAERCTEPILPWDWSIKDVLNHLFAWQLLSTARLQAVLDGAEPVLPVWFRQYDPDNEDTLDDLNAAIQRDSAPQEWTAVYSQWSEGYRRLIAVSEQVSESRLLASNPYAFLKGYSPMDVLLGTYDHHAEHLDDLLPRLNH